MEERPLSARVSAVSALHDADRRAVFDYVRRGGRPVSRDQAAAELGVSRRSVAFHLDRLVDEGLLGVEFRRLTGRTGPGAGRPAKLYLPLDDELTVSIPERRYELAAELLATAVERSAATGEDALEALGGAARGCGTALGERHAGQRLVDVLAELGFDPGTAGDGTIVLHNCPFHRLAERHRPLVCGANLDLLTGLADGLGAAGHDMVLAPEPGHCCVRARPRR